MKRLGLLALLLANSTAHSLNIVQGWYGGVLLGLNYTPSSSYVTTGAIDSTLALLPNIKEIFPNANAAAINFKPIGGATPSGSLLLPNGMIATGVPITLKYGNVGQVALQAGYRCGHFRAEGQLGINNSPYSSLTVNNITISDSSSPYYTFQGQTNTGYGMINGYYDVLPSDSQSNFVPFIGAGIGYAYTQNKLQMDFWSDAGSPGVGYQVAEFNFKQTSTTPAGQVMIGGSYFLDDFSAFSLDLRYFTTQKKAQISSARVEVISINLTFDGAFNFG